MMFETTPNTRAKQANKRAHELRGAQLAKILQNFFKR